jgi:N-acetylglucosaminyl-diphospho-decaprenol L-rhamnosyltransferase
VLGIFVAAASGTAIAALVIAAILVGCVLVAFRAGERGIRGLLLAVIVISPFRGALLSLLGELHLGHRLLVVNAIQPALIGAAALATLVNFRDRLERVPRLLRWTWVAIAAIVALDLPFHGGGLDLYGVGAVQYLTYPTFAVLAFVFGRRSDIRPISVLLVGLGTIVAITVLLEAIHLVKFVQARPGAHLHNPRYGGSTGSFLHASIFIGAAIPIGLGLMLGSWSRIRLLDATAIGAILLGAMILTYGRGGLIVAGLGIVILLFSVPRPQKLRLAGVCALAVAISLPVAAAAGRSPSRAFDRITSSVQETDTGNGKRFHNMKRALDRWSDGSVIDKAVGQGLATTGNTGRVLDEHSLSTESYPLKLLDEVGVLGLLAIGIALGFCAWAMGRVIPRAPDPLQAAIGATGVAMTLDFFVYQTLEPQLLAMTWWLLLAMALVLRATPASEPLGPVAPAPRRKLHLRGAPPSADSQATGLDVVVVSYRSPELLRSCLASLRENPPERPMKVRVVDNDSGPETTSMVEREFPEVELTPLAENAGFSAANNLGIDAGRAPYVLVLNPDTRVLPGALDHLLALMDGSPKVGMSGPRLALEDGSPDHAAKRSFPTPLSALGHFSGIGRSREHGALADYRAPGTESGAVDAVNGAFMLIRRSALDQVGLFDEGYWMYMEDLDLCYRFAEAGWVITYDPSVTVIHVKAGTSGQVRSARLNYAFHYGMYRFYRTHYARQRSVFVNVAVYAGIAAKAAFSIARSWVRRRSRRDERPED